MNDDEFHTEVITRLARIETKQDDDRTKQDKHELDDKEKFKTMTESIEKIRKFDWKLTGFLIAGSHILVQGGSKAWVGLAKLFGGE